MDERKDKTTRTRLDEIEADYQRRVEENRKLILEIGAAYHRFSRITIVILLVLVLVGIGTSIATFQLRDENSQRITDIQNQRVEFVRYACEDQNARHDATLQKLDHVVAAIKDPVQRARAETSKAGSVALIEALVPKQDCAALAESVLDPPPPPAVERNTGPPGSE